MGNQYKKLLIASICNNVKNLRYYKIKGKKCYYKGEFIGEIGIENIILNQNQLMQNWKFKPIKTIYTDININL